MSAFEKAAYIYLAGGRNSLTFTLNGVKYFVSVKDVMRAIKSLGCTAQIVTIAKPKVQLKPTVDAVNLLKTKEWKSL
jgi:hypothetical protein